MRVTVLDQRGAVLEGLAVIPGKQRDLRGRCLDDRNHEAAVESDWMPRLLLWTDVCPGPSEEAKAGCAGGHRAQP